MLALVFNISLSLLGLQWQNTTEMYFLTALGAGSLSSETRAPAWSGSGENSVTGLQTATFLLCLQRGERKYSFWCLSFQGH